ncbi:lipopolysaccharide biosynthesis protein [Rurimicrobium arvi]|uniref:Polysaccharide biosynthesis C-terminal domain-containing protein n=1 Tax=Rurimicrobium arvi TaxID=2049916 RepID=A0ABP8N2T1_9BACT
MSQLKKLASQTVWYGLSNIAARFIFFLQTPIVTYLLPDAKGQQAYGEFTILYSGISLLNILFTYGMETAYFRFAAKKEDPEKLFNTSVSTLLFSTICLSLLFIAFRAPIARFIEQPGHPEYVTWAILIIAFDTLSAIPFARLRQQGRPRMYAAIKIAGILLNLLLTVFFLYFSARYITAHPDSAYAGWYQSHSKSGLLLLPNVAQSALTLLLLSGEWKGFRLSVDKELLGRLWRFGSPMIIIGLGGMINETMDRMMLLKLFPGDQEAAKIQVAIYGAAYRISIFVTLFIQAFRMSAEPFFFSQAEDRNAPSAYAQVMKWFVITLCIAFLFTSLYMDIWQYIISPSYRKGLHVVPVLLFANLCLGVYYNLTAIFKVTDHMRQATMITLMGAAITLIINFRFIPEYGMEACAWATCICYFSMMVVAYWRAQRLFAVPYPVRTIGFYLGLMLCLFFIHYLSIPLIDNFLLRIVYSSLLFFAFGMTVLYRERSTLSQLPFIGKYLSNK